VRAELKRQSTGLSVFVALMALTTMIAPVRAQTLGTGILQGTVRDEAGRPLNAVTITLTNRSSGQRIMERTSRGGTYGSALLTPGRYDALFETLGYVPQLLEDVLVVAGTRRDLSVRLVEARGRVESAVIGAPIASLSASGQAGPDRYLTSGRSAPSMPFDGEGLSALLRSASAAGSRHDVEGLPAWLVGTVVDGVPLVTRSRALAHYPRDVGLPLAWFSHVGLLTSEVDIEYPGAGAGYLMGFSRRGGRETTIHGFGDFSSESLAPGADAPAFNSYRAGALLQSSIIRDTASFVVGAEVTRSRSPFASWWSMDSTASRVATAASDAFGADLSSLTQPNVSRLDRESAFGRVDFSFSENASISLRGFFAQIPEPEPLPMWTGSPVGSTTTPRFREIFGSATIISRIDDELMGEVNMGMESSRYMERAVTDRGQALPGTTLVAEGRSFGSSESPTYLGQLTSFYIRGTLHIQSGTHARKIALMAWLPKYEVLPTIDRAGTFAFANVPDFRDSWGYFRTLEGPPAPAEFSMRRVSVSGQDVWRPSPGIELLAGLRVTSFRSPDSTDITLNREWARLSGLTNRGMPPQRRIELEPRFQLTINPGGRADVQIRGGIMIDSELGDPGVIAEIFNDNGAFNASTGFGQLREWPDRSDDPEAISRGSTLAVIGPKFRGPRTTRAFGSMSWLLGSRGAFSAGVTVRRTEFLPERVDLNLLPIVSSRDQFERPILGRLEKRGSLLIAQPESNRRYPGFEHVWGLQAAAQSQYVGITVALERPLVGPLGFFASYTYASTRDNWLIGNPAEPLSQLKPFPDSVDFTDWEDGRSDLDVPHRAVLGAEARITGPVNGTLSALFRYQSGYPFTPGFRPGVDANADGSWYNDPAFIDEAIPGTDALMSAWPCLRENSGRFALRNACRGPGQKSLDARLAIGLRETPAYSATLVVDALNLLVTDDGEVDRAVYLVDAARNLEYSTDGSSVTVPLVANPRFGERLTQFTPQRQLRLGLRLSF
jgi:hypothetical protein